MNASKAELLHRLRQILLTTAGPEEDVGHVDPNDPDVEAHAAGAAVVAFIGDYVLVGIPRGERSSTLAAYRTIARRLEERGETRHMVHITNLASVIATRRLGAVPIGYDDEGYVHYRLTRAAFAAARQHTREAARHG